MNVRPAIIAGRFFVREGSTLRTPPPAVIIQAHAWNVASAQSVIPVGRHPKPSLPGFQAQGLE